VSQAIAIVTGASSGIGHEIVRELASTHRIVALGRDAARLAATGAEITVTADLRDAGEFAPGGKVAALINSLDRVDVLVHSAAVGTPGSFAETDAAEWHRQLTTNVVAPALLTRLALPKLRDAAGTVVFLGSGVSVRPAHQMAAYVASKHALKGLADSLRLEEAEHGVRVTTLMPGQVDTPMQVELQEGLGNAYRPERYLRPETVARAVRYVIDAPADAHLTDLSIRPRVAG
jgi:NADP-dependent 3-hydroxy acid dehydrogenase YdfG